MTENVLNLIIIPKCWHFWSLGTVSFLTSLKNIIFFMLCYCTNLINYAFISEPRWSQFGTLQKRNHIHRYQLTWNSYELLMRDLKVNTIDSNIVVGYPAKGVLHVHSLCCAISLNVLSCCIMQGAANSRSLKATWKLFACLPYPKHIEGDFSRIG